MWSSWEHMRCRRWTSSGKVGAATNFSTAHFGLGQPSTSSKLQRTTAATTACSFLAADPFVTMEIGKTTRKTTTKMQTLTPRWKETFYFDVPNQTDTMAVKAFDYDMIGDNELIGEIEIPLIVAATSHGRPRVYELHHPDPAIEDKRKSVGKLGRRPVPK